MVSTLQLIRYRLQLVCGMLAPSARIENMATARLHESIRQWC